MAVAAVEGAADDAMVAVLLSGTIWSMLPTLTNRPSSGAEAAESFWLICGGMIG